MITVVELGQWRFVDPVKIFEVENLEIIVELAETKFPLLFLSTVLLLWVF